MVAKIIASNRTQITLSVISDTGNKVEIPKEVGEPVKGAQNLIQFKIYSKMESLKKTHLSVNRRWVWGKQLFMG